LQLEKSSGDFYNINAVGLTISYEMSGLTSKALSNNEVLVMLTYANLAVIILYQFDTNEFTTKILSSIGSSSVDSYY
jgi:hypothetical protein